MRGVLVVILPALLAAPGCDQVWGLHRSDDAGAGDDGGSTTVTGRWASRAARNSQTGNIVIDEAAPPGASLILELAADQPIAPSLAADGTFSFERPAGAPYRLTLLRAGRPPVELHHSAAQLDIVDRTAGRLDRVPVTRSTPLVFPNGTFAAGQVIASTGVWTETPIGSVDTLDWNTAVSLSGPVGLLDAALGDRMWFLDREPVTEGAHTYTANITDASGAITLVDGQPQTIAMTPQAHPRSACVDLRAHRMADLARVLDAVPDAVDRAVDLTITSVPAAELVAPGGITLATERVAGGATDLSFPMKFYNSFPGTDVMISMNAAVTRLVALPGADPAVISLGDRTFVQAPESCATPLTIDPAGGLLGTVSLDDIELSSDGKVVPIAPNSTVTLSWGQAEPGPIDVTFVTVFGVSNQDDTTTLTLVREYETTEKSISISSQVFDPLGSYIVRLETVAGYPNAAQGDLRTLGFPLGLSTQYSRLFQVSE